MGMRQARTRTMELERRRLLGGGLALVAGSLLAACGGAAPATVTPVKQEALAPARKDEAAKPATPAAAPKVEEKIPTEVGKPDTTITITSAYDGEAKTLTGAGATFPAALYSKWFNEYEKIGGVKVNYQSIGSGGGIKSIQDQTTDFGATDGPMTDAQLKAARGGPVLHIPMVLGAVVPTYNLPELKETALNFTGETLAGIFLGQIKKWNDAKLVADNPSLKEINKDIIVVRRSDGSGTTFIWVDYLANVSPEWKSKVGVATSVNWPVGIGGKGNEGVAGEVKQNPYAIGYIELIYAKQNRLGIGWVKNTSGAFIEPKLATVSAAAAGVATTITPDLRASIVNAEGVEAYPISGFTWLLVSEQMKEMPKAIALTRLMWWCLSDAQTFAQELGYASLPETIVARAQAKIKSITVDGKSAFPGR